MDRESEWENGYRFSSQLRVRILDTIHLHPYLDTDLVNRWFTVSYGEPNAREEIFYFKRKMWHVRQKCYAVLSIQRSIIGYEPAEQIVRYALWSYVESVFVTIERTSHTLKPATISAP